MQAAWFDRNGPAREVLQVGDLPTPEPGPGEVRIRLHASGVNPSDVKRRSGWRGQSMEYPRVVPHSDGAGVIDAVGAGVPPSRIGERVWTYNAQRGRAHGTAAAAIALPSEQAVRLPDGVSCAAGACLGVPASTAQRCVFADGPVHGKTVLVTGGAGAVGNAAVQLATWGGATVIATVSSAEKADHARAAGAAHVINYRDDDVIARVRELTGNQGVDRIVEVAFGTNLPVTLALLKINGAIGTYAADGEQEPRLPFCGLMSKNCTVHFVLVYLLDREARRRCIADITAALEVGALRPEVARCFPLAEIAAAHEAVESGKVVGNVVVDIA